jgi:adenine phosphoribosyltransferase
MTIEDIKKSIRNVPDFPTQGIQFKDITTAFKDGQVLQKIANLMYDKYKNMGITKIVGIESRGFIMGAILAEKLGIGFVPIRKKGKLPAETNSESYEKERTTTKRRGIGTRRPPRYRWDNACCRKVDQTIRGGKYIF